MTIRTDLSSIFAEQADHRLSQLQIRNLLKSHILVSTGDLAAGDAVGFIRDAQAATAHLQEGGGMTRLQLSDGLRAVAEKSAPAVAAMAHTLAENLVPQGKMPPVRAAVPAPSHPPRRGL